MYEPQLINRTRGRGRRRGVNRGNFRGRNIGGVGRQALRMEFVREEGQDDNNNDDEEEEDDDRNNNEEEENGGGDDDDDEDNDEGRGIINRFVQNQFSRANLNKFDNYTLLSSF
jgi:hypothetical protein